MYFSTLTQSATWSRDKETRAGNLEFDAWNNIYEKQTRPDERSVLRVLTQNAIVTENAANNKIQTGLRGSRRYQRVKTRVGVREVGLGEMYSVGTATTSPGLQDKSVSGQQREFFSFWKENKRVEVIHSWAGERLIEAPRATRLCVFWEISELRRKHDEPLNERQMVWTGAQFTHRPITHQ